MLSASERLAARLVTGPVAFFVAGVIDIGVFAIAVLHARVRKGLGSSRT
jgi:hypothetical protein